jgi:hypothetical protein
LSKESRKIHQVKPVDSLLFEQLKDGTKLILFDYPMDRPITKGGTYYRDLPYPKDNPIINGVV